MNNKDLYKILGVDKNATQQEIKTAYRKLAKKYHPDILKDGTSDQKMKDLNEAYSVLSDETKRKQYDQFGYDGMNNAGGFNAGGYDFSGGFGNFGDFFENIFSGGFGGFSSSKNSNAPKKGQDWQVTETISFTEAIQGVSFEKEFDKFETCLQCGGSGAETKSDIHTCQKCSGQGYEQRVQNGFFGQRVVMGECSQCHGEGKIITKNCLKCNGKKYIKTKKKITINIPAGASNSTRLKLSGFAGAGTNGGPSGDLYIKVNVKPHKFFTREGNDILVTLPVSFIDLYLEKNILVPTPYGEEKIKLKKSYQNGQYIMLKGRGVKTSSKTGDLYFKIQVFTPEFNRKDTKILKELFEQVNDNSNQEFIDEVKKAK
ncbi:molecular chaperone DnaJ [Mycoplasma buteonis]|uniref:molecular chaperone DnaJ n=1 Tax=Mycoplasma buteonis TaxID=171280 RepID=UPI00055CEF45|nr:molecular chaperone DnaJ [Mycoplasma buteonis]